MLNIGCWGTGRIAEISLSQMKNTNMHIKCFCDCNKEKWGKYFFEYPIVNPQEFIRMKDIDLIVVTTGYWESVLLQCLELDVDLEKIRCWNHENKKLSNLDEMYKIDSYSLNGEDIYLSQKFSNKKQGIYVDVGSFHPLRYSNTYWAYLRGWSGINIEPNTENYLLFEKLRPRDININCGISEEENILEYYRFEESALNTFCSDMANYYKDNGWKLKDTTHIKMKRLDNILNENNIKSIDFLDIDVEGMEMSILESIDYNIDIECILLEQGKLPSLLDVIESREGKFLNERGYSAVGRYGITTIFEKTDR